MKCIKNMIILTELQLAYNNFQKLAKISFKKLVNLNNLDLSNNPLKTISHKVFAFAPNLKMLNIDKFASYESVTSSMKSISHLSLTVDTLECDAILKITDVLTAQGINIKYNNAEDSFVPSSFTCQTDYRENRHKPTRRHYYGHG